MTATRKRGVFISTRKGVWMLGNSRCTMSVSREDGTLTAFVVKKRNEVVDIWRGQRGGISIYDELENREYSDFSSRIASLTWTVEKRSSRCVILSLEKRYRGAPFVVTERITAERDHVRLDLEICKTRGRDRSIRVKFIFPFPMLPSAYLSEQYNQDEGFRRWMLWAPTFDAPFLKGRQNDVRRQDLIYNLGAGRGGITVPIVSAYLPDDEVDAGYSLISPVEVYKPKLVFEVEREFGDEYYVARAGHIAVATYHLGLRRRRAAVSSVIVVPHEGDWRPGLGWMYRKYKPYFRPTNERIYDQEGVMLYALPCWPEAKIREWKEKMGLRWQEVRYEWRFGDYVPDHEPWKEDAWKTEAHPERELAGLTYKRMNDYLELLRRYGIFGFAYFQIGGDVERRFCKEKGFEDFVVRRKDGSRFPGCTYPDGVRKTWIVNPVPNSRWEKHILGQAKAIFDKYPRMAGLFVDQLCYRFLDYSRDDGVTMVDNRPAWNNHLSYIPLLKKLNAILRKLGKTTFGNGPTTMDTQRHIDGVMAEHRLDFLGTQAYVTLGKPLVMLTSKVSDMKWCLKYGAFPHVFPHDDRWPNKRKCPPDYVKAFKAYLPLFELMRGKEWVLTPHALTLPPGIDGNIFRTRAGDYVISVIPKEYDFDSAGLTLGTRLADAKNIRAVYFLGVESVRKKRLAFSRTGTDVTIPLPPDMGIGVLHLKKGK